MPLDDVPPLDRRRTVPALGAIEIVAWGSSYYLMTILAPAISTDMGWSMGSVSVGVSIGLVVSGLASPAVGRTIHRLGGARVMSVGLVSLATGLALMAASPSLLAFYCAWAVIGLGMSATLYDAAFATLGQIFGSGARAAITKLTLWGGFASTVSWPLTAYLLEQLGWRGTALAYAGLHLTITLPLSLLALPRHSVSQHRTTHPRTPADPMSGQTGSGLRLTLFAFAGMGLTFLVTASSVHLVALLSGAGYSTQAAIALGTLIGPAQVGARLLELLGRGRHHPIWTMSASAALMLAGLGGLILGLPAFAALVAYGAGNGLWSIARGAVPLALFGPENYAPLIGRLAMPFLLTGASAPFLGAMLIDDFGSKGALAVLGCVAIATAMITGLLAVIRRAAE